MITVPTAPIDLLTPAEIAGRSRASATAMVAREAARAVRRRQLDAGAGRVLDGNRRMTAATPALVRS